MENVCKVEGCCKKTLSRCYCSKHYRQKKNQGYFDHCECIIDGCKNNATNLKSKMCIKHITRIKRYNDANTTKIIRGEDRSKNELYTTYNNIKDRCYNQKNHAYKRYGGRGIVVDDRWIGNNGFNNFCEDMGDRPEGYTIDRINNDGNYCKENCRWTCRKTQANNTSKSLVYKGETATDAQKRLGLCRGTISGRIKSGWSIEEAFTTPLLPNDSSRKKSCVGQKRDKEKRKFIKFVAL